MCSTTKYTESDMIELIQDLVTNCGYIIISMDDHQVQLENSLNDAAEDKIITLHTYNYALSS